MDLKYNPHLSLLEHFYLKRTLQTAEQKKAVIESNQTLKKQKGSSGTEINFSWNYGTIPNDLFSLPSNDFNKLNNYSFIHSILYMVDSLYYSSNIEQQLKDCKEFIEVFRTKFFKDKLSKDQSDIIKNVENNLYTENTIQAIINYLNSFHLIILSKNKPKLYINGSYKKNIPNYTSSSNLVIIYYDELREIYIPLEYKLDNRDTFYISWREPYFLEMLKKVLLYNQPVETKKWAVADLRNWITFFKLDIDISLDKKQIIEKIGTLQL